MDIYYLSLGDFCDFWDHLMFEKLSRKVDMNTFQVKPIRQPSSLQYLYPPKSVHVAGSKPLHTHISPSFSNRIPIEFKPTPDVDESGTIDDQVPMTTDSTWNVDIPIQLIHFPHSGTNRIQETKTIRLSLDSDFAKPFPQSHKIAIMDPIDDLFFHWTFHCTPFTFTTLAKQMNWTLGQSAGDAFDETFRRFGYLIQECGHKVATYPDRYSVTFTLSPNKSLATLVFLETVNEYRVIDLLSLDFIPSAWSDIKKDVMEFTKNVMGDHEQAKMDLIQVMEMVSKHQPSILLEHNGLFDSLKVYQPKEWMKAKEKLDSPNTDSIKERIEKVKQFLEETDDGIISEEAIVTKSLPVPIMENDKVETKELICTFYYTRAKNGIPAYQIKIADASDMFFNYESDFITPEKFFEITQLIQPSFKNQIKTQRGISRSRGLSHGVPVHGQGRANQLGFHDPSGVTGVVGVIASDYMDGCIQFPERYKCKFIVSTPISQRKDHGKSIQMESHIPPLTEAIFEFSEYVLFKERTVLRIEFHSMEAKQLQATMRRKCSEIQFQISQCRYKLASILKLVSCKNVALYSLLDKKHFKNRMNQTIIPRVDENTQYGYKGWKDFQMPSPELFGNRDVHMIPTRDVVEMKIPIFVAKKSQKSSKPFHHKPRDPWIRLSEKPMGSKNAKESHFKR